jgi:hypothetical protein
MKNTKTLLAIIPLAAIAVIAIGIGMSSNVFAQPTTSTTVDPQDNANSVDRKEGPNDVADSQTKASTADNGSDNHQDGEQNDKTELKK